MAEKGRRRAGRSRGSGWNPLSRKGKRQTFLPRLPDHSETGTLARATPEELLRRGIDPATVPPRKKRLAERTLIALLIRWRYYVTTLTALFLSASLVATSMVLLRDAGNDENKLPSQKAPTLKELNESIALSRRYITALYKPLDGGQAVQSEASGVPLRAYFPDENTWVLLGEDKEECSVGKDDCERTTSLTPSKAEPRTDEYDITFSTKTVRRALALNVKINWYQDSTSYQITTKPSRIIEPVELWLDKTKLASYTPGKHTITKRKLKDDEQSRLRMLRFTIRHATQEAYLYWTTYGHDPKKAAALKKFLEANGYKAGYDLRAPLFNDGDAIPDDMPLDDSAYPDCDHIAASSQYAYAYRSKVCLYESAYLTSGERDPFLQAWEALTVLVRHKNPNYQQPGWGWWMQGDTPAEVSKHLRGQWNRSGKGIPKCTPFSCAELSSIRTSVFGALEAKLGYEYGDAKAKKFADAAAAVLIQTQVKVDGSFIVDNGKTYGRPGQAGSFLSAWNTEFEFKQPSTPKLPVAIALLLRGAHPTPLEFDSIIPSNSETSFDALAYLEMYRCYRYKVCHS